MSEASPNGGDFIDNGIKELRQKLKEERKTAVAKRDELKKFVKNKGIVSDSDNPADGKPLALLKIRTFNVGVLEEAFAKTSHMMRNFNGKNHKEKFELYKKMVEIRDDHQKQLRAESDRFYDRDVIDTGCKMAQYGGSEKIRDTGSVLVSVATHPSVSPSVKKSVYESSIHSIKGSHVLEKSQQILKQRLKDENSRAKTSDRNKDAKYNRGLHLNKFDGFSSPPRRPLNTAIGSLSTGRYNPIGSPIPASPAGRKIMDQPIIKDVKTSIAAIKTEHKKRKRVLVPEQFLIDAILEAQEIRSGSSVGRKTYQYGTGSWKKHVTEMQFQFLTECSDACVDGECEVDTKHILL